MNAIPSLIKFRSVSFAVLSVLSANAMASQPSNALSQVIQTMQPGTWALANQNTFDSVWTPAADRFAVGGDPNSSYTSNLGGIIKSWSSFAWDSNRGDMILYGGGHNTYTGNEVYTWHSSTLQWDRASLPTNLNSVQEGTETRFFTVDNGVTPQSSHTYDNNVYLPTVDRFLTFGGYVFTTTSGTPYLKQDTNGNTVLTGPYLFDPSRADGNKVGGADGTGVNPATLGGNMWQNRDIYANLANPNIPQGFGLGKTDVFQQNGKDVVLVSVATPPSAGYGFSLYEYIINDINNPALDTWTLVGSDSAQGINDQGTGAYDPNLNIFVTTGVDNYNYFGTNVSIPFFFWDLNHPGVDNQKQAISVIDNTGGLFSFADLRNYGLEYDPTGQQFLLWGGGDIVFSLTAPSGGGLNTDWILGVENPLSSSGPGGALANAFPDNGVLGKWHYASDLGVFVGLKDNIDGNVWVYKPTDYVGSAPVPLPATVWLFGSAIVSLRFFGKRKKQ